MCLNVVPRSAISSTSSTRLPRSSIFGSAVTFNFPCLRALYDRADTTATSLVSNSFATSASGKRPLTVIPIRHCGLNPLERTARVSLEANCSTCRHERLMAFVLICDARCELYPENTGIHTQKVLDFERGVLG